MTSHLQLLGWHIKTHVQGDDGLSLLANNLDIIGLSLHEHCKYGVPQVCRSSN